MAVIDTGEPRNVIGHMVSGAVASAIVSGSINYKKIKDEQISSQDGITDTIKKTSQGAIATASAIATANYLGQKGGLLKALSAVSVGILGVYAVEKLDDKLKDKCELIKEDNNG